MKRSPIVIAGTACGMVAVIGYHAAGPNSSLLNGAGVATGAGTAGGGTAGGGKAGHGASSATTAAHQSASAPSASSAHTSTTSSGPVTPSLTRTALGTDVQYPFGDLQVKVTMVGSRINSVLVSRANVLDAQSGAIDQYVFPRLSSQALSAQSARINGISGASYTSAAYAQSLQSALDKLKA